MTEAEICQIQERYEAVLGTLEDLAVAELMFEPGFWAMVEKATQRGFPLTRHEVEEQFPNVSWEE